MILGSSFTLSGIILGTCILGYLLYRWRYRHVFQFAAKLPGPKPIPILGNALEMTCPPEQLMGKIAQMIKEYGDILRVWLGPDLNVIVSDPDDLKQILSSAKMAYKGPLYRFMATVLGGGILSGSGPTWRRHRKIASPNYGKRAIESYERIFNNESDLLMEELRSRSGKGDFNIMPIIVKHTSITVCQTLMGLTREQTVNLPHLQELITTTHSMYDNVFQRMTKWWYQLELVYRFSPLREGTERFCWSLKKFSKRIIEHRTEALGNMSEVEYDQLETEEDTLKNTNLSVIDRFILSKELSYDELITETFTIFTSSQEATAKMTSFLLLMLAYHPEYQEKAYNEIIEVLGDDVDRPIEGADIKRMEYLEMCFKEVLRLFPIGAMLQRSIVEDFPLKSVTLPADSSLVIPIYQLHRDPRYWEDPDNYNPERFSRENSKKRNSNTYIPFSLGPMDCLGRYFGTKLIKTIAAKVLREFKLTSKETYSDMRIFVAVSVASVNGYPVSLTPRKPYKNIIKDYTQVNGKRW